MKIGILTQPLLNNYGGLLQNYALQQVLKGTGHEVITIDQGVPKIDKGYKERLYEWILSTLKPEKYSRPKYLPTESELTIIRKETNRFIEKYITHTTQMMSYDDFYNEARNGHYDAFIVGSDQCWRPCFNPFLTSMFLDFVKDDKDVKKIAYAASLGTDTWDIDDETTPLCASLAKEFDLISVREKNAVELCNKYLGVKAYHVLDPTMLLSKSDYKGIIEEEREEPHAGTLFYYILDPSSRKMDFINKIAKKHNLKPFTVMPKYQAENRTKKDVKKRIEDCVFPSVTSWLRAFEDAKMVIADSFHGTVFSIIFNKPFWVIGNESRGNSRFDSLLCSFNLENRFVGATQYNDNLAEDEIEWTAVNTVLQDKRTESLELLFNHLK